jgi:hypothetical protein
MNAAAKDGVLDEATLIKLYMDLTGASEASARNVYMFVYSENSEEKQKLNGLERWKTNGAHMQATANHSLMQAQGDDEFGIGLLGSEGMAFSGK